jgi:hypothetical protein
MDAQISDPTRDYESEPCCAGRLESGQERTKRTMAVIPEPQVLLGPVTEEEFRANVDERDLQVLANCQG